MPVPGTYNITTYKGDTLVLTFELVDDTEPTPLPIDLSSATFKMQVRKKSGDPVLWEAATDDGIVVSGADNNIVTVSKIVDAEAGVNPYVYDIQATFLDGTVRTYVAGTFMLRADVTV